MGMIHEWSDDEIKAHYTADKDGWHCVVCDDPRPSLHYTDLHMEGRCNTCGIPYRMIVGEFHEDVLYERLGITSEDIKPPYVNWGLSWVPMLRVYWQEKQVKIPAGQYLGKPDGWHEQMVSLTTWMIENRDRLAGDLGIDWEYVEEATKKLAAPPSP